MEYLNIKIIQIEVINSNAGDMDEIGIGGGGGAVGGRQQQQMAAHDEDRSEVKYGNGTKEKCCWIFKWSF